MELLYAVGLKMPNRGCREKNRNRSQHKENSAPRGSESCRPSTCRQQAGGPVAWQGITVSHALSSPKVSVPGDTGAWEVNEGR